MRRVRAAELTTDSRNALDDSQFAVPGKRKLPIHDAKHVRAALSRFGQTKGLTDAERATAKTKIKAAAKKHGIEVSDDFTEWEVFAEPLLVAGPKLEIEPPTELAETVRLPFVRVGEWNFRDSYGQREITDDDLDAIVSNFQRDARRQDIPLLVNEEHAEPPAGADLSSYVGPGAVGYITKLERDGDTVYADVEPNRLGAQLLADDRYRAVSPELMWNWIDPETDEAWGKTAVGLALTTVPKMKGLAKRGAPLLAAAERVMARIAAPRVLAFAERTYMADGDGMVDCPTCDGDGKIMGGKRQCPDCKGAKQVTKAKAAQLKGAEDVHVDRALPNFSVSYAFPDRKRLPLDTLEQVKGSVARFQTVEADEQERDRAWATVKAAADEHGVTTPDSWRELRASEAARALLAEMDDAEEAAEPALCLYQPPIMPIGCCPGYTRPPNDDNDGDVDVCVLWKDCNGYIPAGGEAVHIGDDDDDGYWDVRRWATSAMPQRPGYYGETSRTAGAPMDPKDTKDTKTGTQVVTAAEPKPAPAATSGDPQGAPTRADFAELQALVKAGEVRITAAEERAKAAETEAASARGELAAMKAAERLTQVTDRLEKLVASGRITPATRDKFCEGENLVKFAEQPFLLDALEQMPAGHAVPMGERGSGAEEHMSEDTKIVNLAEQIRRETASAGGSMTVKQSVIEAAKRLNKVGYRA